LAEDRQPRNGAPLGSLEGAPLRRAPAPTRCSCTMHCKEQARNNGIGPAKVSYSPRLVRRAGRLEGFSAFARLRGAQATKSPQQVPARAAWRNFGEYAFLEDSRYASQQKNMRRKRLTDLATAASRR